MKQVFKALLITIKHFSLLIIILALLLLVVFGTAIGLFYVAKISFPLAMLCGVLAFVFLVMFIINLREA